MVWAPLGIGKLQLASNVLMAPMVGLSTRPFRILALRHGCALSAAEMLNSEYLVRATREQRAANRVWPEERPAAIQIVGSRVEAMADSAAMVEDFGADVLDLNMGCPVRRITKGGGGVALMRDPDHAARIVEAMVSRVSIPVTVKIRAGISEEEMNAPEVARKIETAGAAAIAVHARTQEERHRGAAHLDVLRAVKAAVRIPVVGNGGLRTPADAERMLVETGVDGVMFGRGAVGDVWVFERTLAWLRDGREAPDPTPREKVEVLAEHLRLLVREHGKRVGVAMFRKCLPHYLKGIPGAREARHRLTGETEPERVIEEARRLYSEAPASDPVGVSGTSSPRQER